MGWSPSFFDVVFFHMTICRRLPSPTLSCSNDPNDSAISWTQARSRDVRVVGNSNFFFAFVWCVVVDKKSLICFSKFSFCFWSLFCCFVWDFVEILSTSWESWINQIKPLLLLTIASFIIISPEILSSINFKGVRNNSYVQNFSIFLDWSEIWFSKQVIQGLTTNLILCSLCMKISFHKFIFFFVRLLLLLCYFDRVCVCQRWSWCHYRWKFKPW